MLLGVLRSETEATLNFQVETILQGVWYTALRDVRSGLSHVRYISENAAKDAIAANAIVDAVGKTLIQCIDEKQCHVGVHERTYGIDPGWQQLCANEVDTCGVFICIDFRARGVKPAQISEVQGKLLTREGQPSHVRVGPRGVHDVWFDCDGTRTQHWTMNASTMINLSWRGACYR